MTAESNAESTISRWRMAFDVTRLTTGEMLAARVASCPDKVFLRYLVDGRSMTFAETAKLVGRLAGGLSSSGVSAGRHIAIMLDNSPELVLSHLAVGVLGAVTIPVNSAARGAILKHLLVNSDSEVLIIARELFDRYLEIAPDLPAIRTIVLVGDGGSIDERECAAGVTVLELAALAEAEPVELTGHARFDSLAYILYTSGTTGPSKGVMISQARNLLWGIEHAEAYGHRGDDIFYVCLPLFHVNALQGSLYMALTLGAEVVVQRKFSASRFWSDIRETQATITNMLGSMVNILWGRARTENDRSTIRMCLCAPIPPFGPEFEERFGLRFIAAYSLTDFGASHALTVDAPRSKLRSCGRVRAGFHARIVDADDFPVSRGEPGELVLRSDRPWNTSTGYYGLPEVTLKAWRNGWFHTGDLARIDTDGYLWFVDRQKDVVRRRGENVSAFEVEQIILSHPSVADVAVFPIKSDMSEEEVAAAIVFKEDQPTQLDEVIAHCQRNMPGFMVPRFVAAVPDLPRNASQKIEKTTLRRMAEEDRSGYWDREATNAR